MQRTIINPSALRSTRLLINKTSARTFSSASRASTRSSLSKWALPSAMMAIGISSLYLSQPLFLDTKKVKEATKAEETKEIKPEIIERAPETIEKAPETSEEKPQVEGEEGEQQAAYNPETGEINWDCPCLGGMAHGPCGEEFKEAFSCFVYSEADPKGFDCVEKFKNMQNCFRKYPDVYSEEIRDEESAPVDTSTVPADQSLPIATEDVQVAATEQTTSIAVESQIEDSAPVVFEGAEVTKSD